MKGLASFVLTDKGPYLALSTGVHYVDAPAFGEALSVSWHGGRVVVWMLVDDAFPAVKAPFFVARVGSNRAALPLPDGIGRYLGPVSSVESACCWHVFELSEQQAWALTAGREPAK